MELRASRSANGKSAGIGRTVSAAAAAEICAKNSRRACLRRGPLGQQSALAHEE
jgi:hypothetical protein